jgi:hypothetical protein
VSRNEYLGAAWRKSRYSNGQAECVEIADNLPGIVAVRDSKDKGGTTLAFGAQAWKAFTAKVKRSLTSDPRPGHQRSRRGNPRSGSRLTLTRCQTLDLVHDHAIG